MKVYRVERFPDKGGAAIFSSAEKAREYCKQYRLPKNSCYHIYTHEIDSSGYTFFGTVVKEEDVVDEFIHTDVVKGLLKEAIKEVLGEGNC